MVVSAHAAAESETLVDGIIPDEEVVHCRLGGVVVVGIVGKAGEHIFQIVPGKFAFLAVQFVGCYDGSTDEAVIGGTDIGSLECAVGF